MQFSRSARVLLPLLVAVCTCTWALSQNGLSRCSFDDKMQAIYDEDPAYLESIQQSLASFYKERHDLKSAMLVTIPVHVIIVHPPGQAVGSGSNLSMARIESQITAMTVDFRRLNPDAANTPPEFPAADVMVEFCLATVDPNGQPTDGVTRHATNQNFDNNEFSIKQATRWDRNTYLNMWVAPSVGAAGYAYVPSTGGLPNPVLDGVVVNTIYFGGPGSGASLPYDLGRTAVHEIGHYLGLGHVWGGGCGGDDGFADTPNQNGPNWGCPNHPSPSCGNGGDYFMNYMDYVDDFCYNAFSVDQASYMQLILNTSRASLLNAASFACNFIPSLSGAVLSVNDLACFADASGSFTVEGIGGSPPYGYSIDGVNFNPSGTFSGLPAGSYLVTISDEAGQTFALNVTVDEPDPLFATIAFQQDVDCDGNENGVINVEGVGGSPGAGNTYTFSIDGGSFSSQNFFENLSGGTYTLTVQDSHGCLADTDVDLFEPDALLVSVQNQADVSCFGLEDGSVEVSVSGGVGDYTYALNGGDPQDDPVFSGLAPGSYDILVTDDNACFSNVNIDIDEPNELVIDNVLTTDNTCGNDAQGIIDIIASGGTGTLQYSIDGVNFQPSGIFDMLDNGDYNITVQDDANCMVLANTAIESPDGLQFDMVQIEDVVCFGDSDGSVQVSASGGMSDITYTLDGNVVSDDGSFPGLPAGDYEIVASDDSDCSATIMISVSQNDAVTAQATAQSMVSCYNLNDGSVTIEGGGGTGNYVYSQDGMTFDAVNTFSDLSAGSHTIYVQDDAGCQTMTSVSIDQPDELEYNESTTDVLCFSQANGTVQIQAVGGTGPYTYMLNNETNNDGLFLDLSAADYAVQIEDTNGCTTIADVSVDQPDVLELMSTTIQNIPCGESNTGLIDALASGGTTPYIYALGVDMNDTGMFSNLPAGDHHIMVMDANGCQAQLPFQIDEQEDLGVNVVSIEDVDCFGADNGMVDLAAFGGDGSYVYELDGITNTNGSFSTLSPGDYDVFVSDENGCETQIAVSIIEPEVLTLDVDILSEPICFGYVQGEIDVSVSGGTGMLSIVMNNQTINAGVTAELPGGSYDIVVEDINGCRTSQTIHIQQPEELLGDIGTHIDISCFGENDGAVAVQGVGGTGDYTYTLVDEVNGTGMFSDLTPGLHTVEIRDENGCAHGVTVQIDEPDVLDAEVEAVDNISCFGAQDGSMSIQGMGGTGDYVYTLDDDMNTAGTFTDLGPGQYDVEVIDANGCTYIVDIHIDEPGALIPDVGSVDHITCYGLADGRVEMMATGGSPGYRFELGSTENDSGVFDGLSAGKHEGAVIDANGCRTEISVTVTEPEELVLDLIRVDKESEDTGVAEVRGQGGVPPYSYSLDGTNFQDSPIFGGLARGDHEIIVRDANGCRQARMVTVDFSSNVQEIEALESMVLWPNPFHDVFRVRINAITAGPADFRIYGVNGQLIQQKRVMIGVGNQDFEFSAADFAAGVYIVQLTMNARSAYFRMHKM